MATPTTTQPQSPKSSASAVPVPTRKSPRPPILFAVILLIVILIIGFGAWKLKQNAKSIDMKVSSKKFGTLSQFKPKIIKLQPGNIAQLKTENWVVIKIPEFSIQFKLPQSIMKNAFIDRTIIDVKNIPGGKSGTISCIHIMKKASKPIVHPQGCFMTSDSYLTLGGSSIDSTRDFTLLPFITELEGFAKSNNKYVVLKSINHPGSLTFNKFVLYQSDINSIFFRGIDAANDVSFRNIDKNTLSAVVNGKNRHYIGFGMQASSLNIQEDTFRLMLSTLKSNN